MTPVRSTLPDTAREAACEALQDSLVDLLGLSLIAKQVHWNVVGPRFRSVHLQLDEVVSTARSYADTVAERSAALGVPPDGRAATVAADSAPKPPETGWVRDDDVVELMIDALEATIRRLRERIDATEKHDLVTQDLLLSITAELEEHRWMFQAENYPDRPGSSTSKG